MYKFKLVILSKAKDICICVHGVVTRGVVTKDILTSLGTRERE
jgi:hypothetical protein